MKGIAVSQPGNDTYTHIHAHTHPHIPTHTPTHTPTHMYTHTQGEIWVGADNQEECMTWVKALKEAGKV